MSLFDNIRKIFVPKDEEILNLDVPNKVELPNLEAETEVEIISSDTLGNGSLRTVVNFDQTTNNIKNLILTYRDISLYPEVDSAITEITNEAIVSDTNSTISLEVDSDEISKNIKEKIITEFNGIVNMMDFKNIGDEIFRQWYEDGRIYLHGEIDLNNMKLGIQNIKKLSPFNLRRIKEDDVYFYVYEDQSTNTALKIPVDHITYCSSGLTIADKRIYISYLHRAIRPFNQLKMLEDSAVIYRITRAPERRVFYVDVGQMNKSKAESYMQNLMNKFKNKITYDSATGKINQKKDSMTMTEDFWLPSCITLDTKIPLMDGRELELQEIIKEYNNGNELWAYSISDDDKIVPGLISWAGETRKNTKVMEITLDNNEKIKSTLDHKFILKDGTIIEAEQLKINDSLKSGTQEKIVIDIKFLEETYDTGTLTIDKDHLYHNHHNFAICSGIFIKNSESSSGSRGTKIDTLPAGCLAMDTKVSLLDGRELSIKEIENEMKEGNELWTYSCHPETGEITPGLISWAGVTQKSAKVMKITLDNNECIICTPDHEFPIYDKGFIRADELDINEKMITNKVISDNKIIEYLDEEIEVGTLTIDINEKYNNYHTFALSVGVFTKNSNLGDFTDIEYFKRKLLKSLRVPYSRFDQEQPGMMGFGNMAGEMSRDEVRFGKFINKLRNKFGTIFFDLLKKQLIFKKIISVEDWIEYKEFLNLKWATDSYFSEVKEAEIQRNRTELADQMEAYIGKYFSNSYIMKNIFKMTDEEIDKEQKQIADEVKSGEIEKDEEE